MLTGILLLGITVRVFAPGPGRTLPPSSPGICCCHSRQRFAAFLSPFSSANQLPAGVTWAGSTVFAVRALGAPCARAGTSGVPLPSGTDKWGSLGAELTPAGACSVNPPCSCGAGLSRARRHHALSGCSRFPLPLRGQS